MPANPLEIVVLSEDEYQREYKKSFEEISLTNGLTKEAVASEFDAFNKLLRKALSKRWKESPTMENDFAISDEWQGTWHHCGGIYSAKICRAEYVMSIVEVISQLAHASEWTYHTALEVADGKMDFGFGEFFIRDGKMYAPDDGNDYPKHFGSRGTKVQKRHTEFTIHTAAEKGDIDAVRRCIESDASLVNSTDHVGRTPLHRAIVGRVETVAEFLILNGADIDASDVMKYTPLHLATDSETMVELLLKHGASVHARDMQGKTPLHLAAMGGRANIAERLVEAGTDVNATDDTEQTPLFWASADVTTLLLQHGAQVNALDKNAKTPLHVAAECDHVQTAVLLIERGAELDTADRFGMTPLRYAASKGSKELVELLLNRGVDPNQKDATKENTTASAPLHIAASSGHLELITFLLDRGVEVNARTVGGLTPLHCAAGWNQTRVMKLLLSRGADIKAQTDQGESPLRWAEKKDSHAAVRLLHRYDGTHWFWRLFRPTSRST